MDCYFSSQTFFCVQFFAFFSVSLSLSFCCRSLCVPPLWFHLWLTMMFWVFWLTHISCCSMHGFYLYQQMHGISFIAKLFAFQSVTLKVYRPYVLVCFQTSVTTFNLILTPLHLRLRRRISSQKWMNKLEFFLQKQHIEWILDMLCLLKRN